MMDKIETNMESETNNFTNKLQKLVEDWVELNDNDETKEGLYENDVRNNEKVVVGDLINYLKTNPNEANDVLLKSIVEEYLKIGDCIDLQKELAGLTGFKFYDPFSDKEPEEGAVGPTYSAGQVLKEIEKKDKNN